MLVDVDFYLGDSLIARGKWGYVPVAGMTMRLELAGGSELFEVLGSEGVGVTMARSRAAGPVPVLHCRAVRVQLRVHAAVPDSPAGWGLGPGKGGKS